MMRLIHCADLHLDSRMTSNLSGEKAGERRRELLLTFERMVKYASEHQAEAVLIAGDLFDTKRISAAACQVVSEAIAGHPEINFFYLRGNHDADSFLAGLEQRPDNLKLFGEEWRSYSLGNAGKVVVSGIELSRANEGRAYHSLMLDPGKFNIVILHGQEAETGTRDRAEVIRLRELKNRGIDYLALGHIHSYQEAPLDGRGVWCYPGCLEGRGFDECGSHGFVMLQVDEETGRWERQFVPFASRTLHTVEADVSGCRNTAEMAERLEAVLKERRISDRDLVKLVLAGSLPVDCGKDLVYLEKRFEQEFYFLKIQDMTSLKVELQEFLLDESLKGEFVRTVMADEELTEEEKAAVIRYGLQAIAGEEVAV